MTQNTSQAVLVKLLDFLVSHLQEPNSHYLFDFINEIHGKFIFQQSFTV